MTKDRTSRFVVGVSFVVAICLPWIWFWPKVPAIMDEQAYLGQAIAITKGDFSTERAGVQIGMETGIPGRRVPKFPPGEAIWLTPFVAIRESAAFAGGLVALLIGAAALALAFESLTPAVLCVALWAFHPSVVLYSRTLMSDLPGAALIACALAALHIEKRRPVLAGALAAASWWFRWANIVPALLLGLGLLIEDRSRGKPWRGDATWFAIGAAPICAALLGYVWWAFGSPFHLPSESTGSFSLANVPGNLGFYALATMIFWPGMLLAPAAYVGQNAWALRLVSYGTILFYSAYYYVTPGGGRFESLVAGQRFLLPAIPALVISYAGVVDWHVPEHLARVRVRIWTRATLIALAVVASVIHSRHQAHLGFYVRAREAIYRHAVPGDVIGCNGEAYKLFDPARGDVHWRILNTGTDAQGLAGFAFLDRPDKGISFPPSWWDEVRKADALGEVETIEGTYRLRLFRAGQFVEPGLRTGKLSTVP